MRKIRNGGEMTVEEIKAKLPEAEVYSLNPDSRYLIVADATKISHMAAEGLLKMVPNAGVLFVADPENAIRILEIKE